MVDHQRPIKKLIVEEFPKLTTYIGKSQNYTVKLKDLKNFGAHHQERRKFRIRLQLKLKIEPKKLLKEGHIENF